MSHKNPEEMRSFFEARYQSYDQHMEQNVQSFSSFYREIARPIPCTDRPLKILDLGCGTGLELKWLWQRAPRALITGIDISPGMLQKLQSKYASREKQLTLLPGNYLEMDLGQAEYDFVLAVMTLHHLLPGPKLELYRKIWGALKAGATYIEGDYYVDPAQEKKLQEQYLQGEQVEDGYYHLDIPLSLPSQQKLLQQAGFRQVEMEWLGEENGRGLARK